MELKNLWPLKYWQHRIPELRFKHKFIQNRLTRKCQDWRTKVVISLLLQRQFRKIINKNNRSSTERTQKTNECWFTRWYRNRIIAARVSSPCLPSAHPLPRDLDDTARDPSRSCVSTRTNRTASGSNDDNFVFSVLFADAAEPHYSAYFFHQLGFTKARSDSTNGLDCIPFAPGFLGSSLLLLSRQASSFVPPRIRKPFPPPLRNSSAFCSVRSGSPRDSSRLCTYN